jgi:hypothetical protein
LALHANYLIPEIADLPQIFWKADPSEGKLLLACASEVIPMISEQQDIRDKAGVMAVTLDQAQLDVALSVEIEAESRRLLYALTIPEYMEAWLQMPGAEKLWCFADPGAPNSFHIDLYSAKAQRARIKGSCLRLDPDRIIYLWRNTCTGNTAERRELQIVRREQQNKIAITG